MGKVRKEKMKTIGIDTNVILTYLTKREPGYEKATEILKNCLLGKVKLFVPQAVIFEVMWVLKSTYKQTKDEIITVIEELLSINNLYVPEKAELLHALELHKHASGLNYIDAVILIQTNNANVDDFLTFDEKLKQYYNSMSVNRN